MVREMFLLTAIAVALHGNPTVTIGSFALNGSLGASYDVGQTWALTLSGAPPNAAFTICAVSDSDPLTCVPAFGKTGQDGSWRTSGTFDASTIGAWTEWLQFQSGARSNRIAFTVALPSAGILAINNAPGGNFSVGQQWTISLAGAPSGTSFDICAEFEGTFLGCTASFGSTDSRGAWSRSGTFTADTNGGWTEWLRFPSGYTTSRIAFTVGTPISNQLYGLDFGPFVKGQDPTTGLVVPESQLVDLIGRIAPYTTWIRTYGATNGLDAAGRIAHQFGLKVALGIWLNSDSAANEREIVAGLAAYNNGFADMLIVGSEALLRNDLSESQLIIYLRRVKQAAPSAVVTTADTFATWLNHPNLVSVCDVIFGNHFAYWDGTKVDQAIASLNATFETVKNHYPDKEIIISESGWPSNGNAVGSAVSSPQNSAAYLLNFVSWARALNRKYFYFETYDEQWKTTSEGPQGAFWGVWTGDGLLKPGMLNVFQGATVPDNWSNPATLLPGGPGTPSIQFTYVPPRGSSLNLTGQALHVKSSDYYVAVFIHVNGGWWTKPYWDSPRTQISSTGDWTCDITTGGIDEQADQIAAFLLPAAYNVSLAVGDSSIPGNPGASAVATANVTR